MMKKWIALLLAVLMLLSAAACTADEAVGILEDLLDESIFQNDTTVPETDAPTTATEYEEPSETYVFTEPTQSSSEDESLYEEPASLDVHGTYSSKEDVALYIHQYGVLPENFISKKDAQALGWTGGSLEPYAPGKCIGGSRFGNYEGLLPTKSGREYTECDINTLGAKSRGAERIVFSNDGLIYYTGDHYESFELLYGVEE